MHDKFKAFLKDCRKNPKLAESFKKDPAGTLKNQGLEESDLPERLASQLATGGPLDYSGGPAPVSPNLAGFILECRENREMLKNFMKDPATTLKENGIDPTDLPAELAEKFAAAGTTTDTLIASVSAEAVEAVCL